MTEQKTTPTLPEYTDFLPICREDMARRGWAAAAAYFTKFILLGNLTPVNLFSPAAPLTPAFAAALPIPGLTFLLTLPAPH